MATYLFFNILQKYNFFCKYVILQRLAAHREDYRFPIDQSTPAWLLIA